MQITVLTKYAALTGLTTGMIHALITSWITSLQAKIEKRPLKDLEIQTACQQTCPTNAIIFGDLFDPNSQVHKALGNERTYYVLQELNVQPGIGYQTKVRNTSESQA